MEEQHLIQRAVSACYTCYELVDEFELNPPAQLMLYRSAAIVIESIVLNDIVSCLTPTKEKSAIDDEFYFNVCEMADNRKWEAAYYKKLRDDVGMGRKAIDATIESIYIASELYGLIRDKLSGSPGYWGCILDTHSLVSETILSAYEAMYACEDTFDAIEYSHSVIGYWSACEAFRASQILIASYSPQVVLARPHVFNIETMEVMFNKYVAGAKMGFESINDALTPEALLVVDSTAKAFNSAAKAVEQAKVNFRAVKLLDDIYGGTGQD